MTADWLTPRHQPLPMTVVPVHDETLGSYLSRLATANRLDTQALRTHITGSVRRGASVRADILSVVSGQPIAVLRHAMLELNGPPELAAMPITGRPIPGGRHRITCTHCVLARGHRSSHIRCWTLHDDVICHRHQRWIGNGYGHTGFGQPDLTGQPEILRAHRIHRALIRRHGRHAVLTAFRQASDICQRWHQRREHDHDLVRLLTIFHGPSWSLVPTDPTIEAARYPQTVSLAAILVSPPLGTRRHIRRSIELPTDLIVGIHQTVAPHYLWSLAAHHGRRDPLVELLCALGSGDFELVLAEAFPAPQSRSCPAENRPDDLAERR